ncbi:LysR family transcriptional regulator [Nocardioides zeae]|uniref:LysR family transcriptional regulator n=1 Tax=Nocardioides imazamoxiresistens TaxID=3231893 RepID=A0ABU3PTG3_9ACTN|nr:LysR family transcriptional regulator [Nocardioides zeae]MDT9592176.1 LysR family transcriptional regulator [Nocardioides zeae]
MDLKQLVAVVTVSEVGSVTRAARLLHVVQPSVTRHVQTLEAELGTALFERTRQGMRTTPAGERFVERARRALQELERARAEIRPDTEEVHGTVTLGLLESTTEMLAGPLARAVEEHLPHVELRLLSAYSGHLQQWLDTGEVDLSLTYNVTATGSVAVVPLLHESLWAVAPAAAGLAAEQPLPWADLWRYPVVLPVRGHGLRSLVDDAVTATGATPRIAVETNSMPLQKELVHAGRGWTVLPAAGVARDIEAGRFSGTPLVEPEISRTVVLGHQRDLRMSRAVAAVARETRRAVDELVTTGRWPGSRRADEGRRTASAPRATSSP